MEFQVAKPKDFVSKAILNAIKVSGETTNIKRTENQINIEFKSAPRAFVPKGIIEIQLADSEINNHTTITCRIIPTAFTPVALFIMTIFVLFFTLLVVLFSPDFNSLVIILVTWLIFVVTIYASLSLNQGVMENYIVYILKSCKLK